MAERLHNSLVIAGPCAAESKEQMLLSAEQAKNRGIDYHRGNPWKPRTKPGFDGEKERALPWIREIAQMGVNPATEVLLPEHAYAFTDEVIKHSDSDVMVWVGSRNQNHEIIQGIAGAIAGEPRAKLLLKNQMWYSDEHWKGMVAHAIEGGASEEQIILCHRGYAPGLGQESNGYRNLPDFEGAMKVKKETGLPMVIDPSHIGGSTERVIEVAEQAMTYRDEDGESFDGINIEVHPEPNEAKTDAKQQVEWTIFDAKIVPLLQRGEVYATAAD